MRDEDRQALPARRRHQQSSYLDIPTKRNASTSTFMADRRRLATEYVTNDLITHYDSWHNRAHLHRRGPHRKVPEHRIARQR